MVKHRFERWTIQQRTSLYNHYFTSESILYERLKETKRYQRENKDYQWLFPDKFVGIDQGQTSLSGVNQRYVYLPCNWLMGMCRWMRLHFQVTLHFDNNGIAFQ